MRIGRTFCLGMAAVVASFSSLSVTAADHDAAAIARGAYLAKVADCQGCHRSTRDPSLAFAGGLALQTPMGTIVASNITPSLKAGIGRYSEQDFARAVTRGIRADGSRLYPAMPYPDYAGMSAADLADLYAYFMHGVTPVDQAAAPSKMFFPFSVRAGMRAWNALFLPAATPDHPSLAATSGLARGKYLVDVFGHCGACHTTHNIAMAEQPSRYLRGGLVDGWLAPNITSDPVNGIGGWSAQELATYLQTGHAIGKASAAGGMADAIQYSLHHLQADDLLAIASYLKQVPAGGSASGAATYSYSGDPKADQRADLQAGRAQYQSACASCHRLAGEGAYGDHFPSLTHNSSVGNSDPTNLIQVILQGIDRSSGHIRTEMPAFAQALNDQQIADLASYVRQRFGAGGALVTADTVAKLRNNGRWLTTVFRFAPWLALIVILIGLQFIVVRRRKRRQRSH